MQLQSFSVKYALRNVWRRKTRNLYAILSIALGISLLLGVQVSVASNRAGWEVMLLRGYGEMEAVGQPISQPYINESLAWGLHNARESIDGIAAVAPRLQLSATALTTQGQLNLGTPLLGVSEDEEGFGKYIAEDGKEIDLAQNSTWATANLTYFADNSTAMVTDQKRIASPLLVGKRLAEELNLKRNDELLLVFAEGSFRFNLTKKVDFIFKDASRGRELNSFALVLRLNDLQALIRPLAETNEAMNRFIISYEEWVNTRQKGIDAMLTLRAWIPLVSWYSSEDVTVWNSKFNTLSYVDALAENVSQILQIFGSLIILAGLLLIVNIQLMSVQEREKQVGVLRAVGTHRRQILGNQIIETVLLGIIGAFLGILGGILYGRFLSESLAWTLGYSPSEIPLFPPDMPTIIFTSFIIGFVLALLTSILPAWRASRLNIVAVMRGMTSPEDEKFGKKGLYFGILLIIIGAYWAITSGLEPWSGPSAWRTVDDAEVLYFIILLPVVGIALTASYFFSKRISLTIMALALLAWPVFNGLWIIPNWLETGSGGVYWIVGVVFSLIAGNCILIGVNLDYVATGVRRAISVIPGMKAIALVAMEQMASKKGRSTMVFAIFSVVLSMNILLAAWSHSTRWGADQTVELAAGGTDLVIVADQPIPTSLDFPGLLQTEFADEGVGLVRPFSVSAAPTPTFINAEQAQTKNLLDAWYLDIIPLDPTSFWVDSPGGPDYESWIFEFELLNEKITELDAINEYDISQEAVKQENEQAWRFLANDSYVQRERGGRMASLPVCVFPYAESASGEPFLQAEESIWLLDRNLQPREFIIETIHVGNALTDWPQTLEGGSPSGAVIFVSRQQAENLLAFETGIDAEALFLVEVEKNSLRSEANDKLANKIEKWANGENGEFRTAYGVYGIAAIPVWDIYEVALDSQFRVLTFLQLFTSGGFLVGVLGLLVVSMRSVQERKREIGMMRSLGFRQMDVIFAVLFELVLMGLIGLVVGLANGLFIAWVIVDINSSGTTTFLIPWVAIGIYAAIVLASAFFAAIIPGWNASRIPPSDALRYTG
ncbi:MAG: ABC transporter permease [Candidatus Heimdallarchaeota archaeon]